ncbi:hypothetical protein [Miltoncostaea marina]|uniref:hypothetical protein n=1 Tax=Miltoncostaea marina TaxID=2843215 RepID=UPI001C3DAC07|nr:hypothetical protein [Miltoncostaea marina]
MPVPVRRPAAGPLRPGALALAVLAATAAPAVGQAGHSLTLAGPPTAVVGAPSVLTASGVVPDDVFLNRYLNVYAIPTGVVAACPATFGNALQLSYAAAAQGGDTVALAVQASGAFTIPVAYTPRVPGRFILCGYLHEGVETMASASLTVAVAGAAVTPRALGKPAITRRGRTLVCARGRWAGAPTRFTYRWRIAGRRAVAGRTLKVSRAISGRSVRCAVTASNAAGRAIALSRPVRARLR